MPSSVLRSSYPDGDAYSNFRPVGGLYNLATCHLVAQEDHSAVADLGCGVWYMYAGGHEGYFHTS